MQKNQQYKIAILYICTGKYDIFWKDFFLSAEKFFLPKHHKEYFIFTDKELYAQDTCSRIHKFYQENLGWPFNTLKRFEMFLRIKEQLKNFDFIFFMNANLEFLKEVNEEFLPIEENLTLVQHAGFYSRISDCQNNTVKRELQVYRRDTVRYKQDTQQQGICT